MKISSTKPTLVILVKGSATLDVTKIATAKVGNASPVVSGVFSVLSKPARSHTGDGRKDRLYFFRPSQTGPDVLVDVGNDRRHAGRRCALVGDRRDQGGLLNRV